MKQKVFQALALVLSHNVCAERLEMHEASWLFYSRRRSGIDRKRSEFVVLFTFLYAVASNWIQTFSIHVSSFPFRFHTFFCRRRRLLPSALCHAIRVTTRMKSCWLQPSATHVRRQRVCPSLFLTVDQNISSIFTTHFLTFELVIAFEGIWQRALHRFDSYYNTSSQVNFLTESAISCHVLARGCHPITTRTGY